MPTIQQLVKSGREIKVEKTKSPALSYVYNSTNTLLVTFNEAEYCRVGWCQALSHQQL